MKNPKLNRALFAVSMALAFSGALSWSSSARAELVREQVQESAITPEAQLPSSDDAAIAQANAGQSLNDEEVVIVRKKKPAPKRRVIIQEVEDDGSAQVITQAAPPVQAQRIQTVTQDAPKAAPGIGSAIDNSINTKMDGVKQQFEDKIVKMLDRIKISVDDDQPAAQPAAAQVAAAPAPLATTIVQDNLTRTNAAPQNAVYMSADQAPQTAVDGTSKAKEEDEEIAPLKGRISIFPMGGITNISSSTYNIDSKYTAGLGLEVEIANNLTGVVSYSYSQYNVGLANSNPYVQNYNGTNLVNSNNLNALEYNQNLIDLGMRFYLMPKSSRFRLFLGAGAGYSKGYLNYNQNTLNTYAGNQYAVSSGQLSDYEVTSVLGELEAGSDIQISKSISIGASFKYDTVLSSHQNDPLNNNAFAQNGYGYVATNDKSIAGGSLSQDGFYSILANIKVSF